MDHDVVIETYPKQAICDPVKDETAFIRLKVVSQDSNEMLIWVAMAIEISSIFNHLCMFTNSVYVFQLVWFSNTSITYGMTIIILYEVKFKYVSGL